MDCREVKKLLIEYFDSTLDKHTKALVQKHLSACKGCSDELAGLKAYKNSLDSLETVTAPADFLEKVHERLKKRTGFKKIMQTIFTPVQLKVPLEAAGAVAAAVAVIFFLRVQSEPRPKQIALAPSESEQELVKKKSMREAPGPLQKEEASKLDAAPEGDVYGSGKQPAGPERTEEITKRKAELEEQKISPLQMEEKPIELALFIKPQISQVHDMPEAALKAAPSTMMKGGMPEGDELTAGTSLDEKYVESKRAAMPVYSLNEAFSRVKILIENSAGNVISVTYETETGMPHYITAEIPAENYTSFLERLYQVGEPEEISTTEDMKDQGFVLLQLELILSF